LKPDVTGGKGGVKILGRKAIKMRCRGSHNRKGGGSPSESLRGGGKHSFFCNRVGTKWGLTWSKMQERLIGGGGFRINREVTRAGGDSNGNDSFGNRS